MKDDQLRAWLAEDAPDDAEALLPILGQLRTENAPPPHPDEAARLAAKLGGAMPRRRWWGLGESLWWLVLRGQLRIIQREIWAASALIMLLGVLTTATQHPTNNAEALSLALLAPIAAAAGVAFIYGPHADPPLELLMALPVSPTLVLLARLALVFGFNLLLGLVSSILLGGLHAQLSPGQIVLAWLLPMTFLSMLAFCLGVLTKEPLLGAAFCLVLRLLQFTEPDFIAAPVLTLIANRPLMLSLALILGVLALWIVDREEYWLGGQNA